MFILWWPPGPWGCRDLRIVTERCQYHWQHIRSARALDSQFQDRAAVPVQQGYPLDCKYNKRKVKFQFGTEIVVCMLYAYVSSDFFRFEKYPLLVIRVPQNLHMTRLAGLRGYVFGSYAL